MKHVYNMLIIKLCFSNSFLTFRFCGINEYSTCWTKV